MALSERMFGPPLGGSSVYLNTTDSHWLDATLGESFLHVPGGNFILEAKYSRLGPDLFLSGEEHTVVIKGFFSQGEAPDLYTTDGHGVVPGSVASRLAGPATPGQFAQAEVVPGIQPIGVVDTAEGRAFLSRLDGINVLAEEGMPVFLGDIVETESGASVGITFIDQSTFALGESGRMIIDELVFDAEIGVGESAFNVLKGVFSFVSGDIAETGDDAMIVNTPVMSIGVRGTTVAGRAAAEGSENTVTLLPDASGTVGAIAVSNSAGVQVMSQAFATTTVTSQFQVPAVPTQLPAASVQDLYGDISTVLPPSPSQRQEESSGDTDAQQQAPQDQEVPLEGAEIEGEENADGEAGPEGEEFLEDERDGLEEGEEVELQAGLEGEGLEEGPGKERAVGDGVRPDEVDAVAEEAYEQALAEGLSPEEADLRARDAVKEAFGEEFGPQDPGAQVDAVAEEAYEQALAEGLSAEEADLRARDAVKEAFGEQFDPEGPGAPGLERPGGEFAEVAEEVFEQALAEGLSREEAGFRARHAVEEAFSAEFEQGVPGDLGPGGEVSAAAGEAFLRALEEGASPEAAAVIARGAATDTLQDTFGGYGNDLDGFSSEQDLLVNEALNAAADQAFEQALSEGATADEAGRRARKIIIGAIDSTDAIGQTGINGADPRGISHFKSIGPVSLDVGGNFLDPAGRIGHKFGPNFGPEVRGGPRDLGLGGPEFGFDPNFEKFVFYNAEKNRIDEFALSQLRNKGIPDIVGTDTGTFDLSGDTLSVTSGEVRTSLFQIDLSDVATINFTGSGFQSLTLDSAESGTSALTRVAGSPTSGRIDDDIFFDKNGGDRDFSGVTFTDIALVEYLDESVSEKMKVSSSTDFGGASILNFEQGGASAADIFDYTSNLKDGKNAATVSNSSDLQIVEFTSQTSGRDQLSNNTSGLVEFKFDAANLAVELQINGEDGRGGGTETAILSAVEDKLESTTAASNLTGNSGQTGAVLNGADGADMLLVFYEASSGISGNDTLDAVIVRYQESGGDADFSGELSLVASFEEVTDFSDSNII